MCRKQKKVPDSHTLQTALKYGMESFSRLLVFEYLAAKENSVEKVCWSTVTNHTRKHHFLRRHPHVSAWKWTARTAVYLCIDVSRGQATPTGRFQFPDAS